jgi:transposase-like protein
MMEVRVDKEEAVLGASERSVEAPKIAGTQIEPVGVVRRPDPEVPAKATRRRFSARYKLRILEQTDGCDSGEVGALLRREGLYHSNLQTWKKQRDEGILEGLTPRKRGRKPMPVNPLDSQLRELQAENRKLKVKIEKFEAMLELQKKVSQLLGISLAGSQESEDES